MMKDIVNKDTLLKHLEPAAAGAGLVFEEGDLAFFEEVGSTNDVILEAAKEGKPEGYLAVATAQTKGRGSKGRAFFSPEDTGLYFSILLRPETLDPAKITVTAAVAVAMALEDLEAEQVGIKWVNDVFVEGKKACGILTEAVAGPAAVERTTEGTTEETVEGPDVGAAEASAFAAVLGIGINCYTPKGGFPEEIAITAGSAFGEDVFEEGRSQLLARCYANFFRLYTFAQMGGQGWSRVVEEYRRRCFILGQDVTVVEGGESYPATTLDVDEQCRLQVRTEAGEEKTLAAGEISLRL